MKGVSIRFGDYVCVGGWSVCVGGWSNPALEGQGCWTLMWI